MLTKKRPQPESGGTATMRVQQQNDRHAPRLQHISKYAHQGFGGKTHKIPDTMPGLSNITFGGQRHLTARAPAETTNPKPLGSKAQRKQKCLASGSIPLDNDDIEPNWPRYPTFMVHRLPKIPKFPPIVCFFYIGFIALELFGPLKKMVFIREETPNDVCVNAP